MANVKVFEDKQPDKRINVQTDRPKTICPYLSIRGHKKPRVLQVSVLKFVQPGCYLCHDLV